VRYTVWSRGRLIGETDLGFIRVINQCRSGWFHPNGEGERVMPVIASVLPAMRAYLHRDAVDALGGAIVQPALHGSTLFADLAEAFQHLQSLDLELRREDGSVVPTSDIGIQDTQQLLELAAEDLDLDDDLCLDDDLGLDEDLDLDDDLVETTEDELRREGDLQLNAELTEEALGACVDELFTDWTPDDLEEPEFPRYQIHVFLLHDDAIP
jgi:hypothetical protein